MHQTMAVVLKTLILSWPLQTPQDILHLVAEGLTTTMFSTLSMVMKSNPGTLVFSCNMLLNVPLIAEWQAITCNREV